MPACDTPIAAPTASCGNWSRTLSPIDIAPFVQPVGPTVPIPQSPVEVFNLFFTDEICTLIVEQTNLYAEQNLGEDEWDEVTVELPQWSATSTLLTTRIYCNPGARVRPLRQGAWYHGEGAGAVHGTLQTPLRVCDRRGNDTVSGTQQPETVQASQARQVGHKGVVPG